jgi:hypothetical protein
MNREEEQVFRNKISVGLDGEILSMPTDTPPTNGACSGQDVSLWFPYFEKETATGQVIRNVQQNSARAKKICTTCNQQMKCLAYGLQHEMWGIWGGYTERERKSLRRKFKISLLRREPVISIQGMNLK